MNTTNEIAERRREINQYFDPSQRIEGSEEILFSPSGKFRVEIILYQQNKPGINWQVIKVDITERSTEQTLFSFFSNHSHFIHQWINIKEIDYLFCAEDIYGGQTVVDLTNRKMASYAPQQEGFIATQYFPSPNKSLLAIIGCVWAGPYMLKLMRLDAPLNLPLPEVMEVDITNYLSDNLTWLKEDTIEFRNNAGKRSFALNVLTGAQVFDE